ncbi:WD40 repeat-like protein [Suillus decipiens]|nr:WD40 repeat-like protein [Suillus decipiens]
MTLNSPVVSAPHRTKEKDPPRYGAQYHQDALWEGGNKALPPQWSLYGTFDGRIEYQDDALVIPSLNRPLPGVRLDYPGQLVPGCEWHISPLGRSYFVNHNTRTTSWKKPSPKRPPGSLAPERIIEGHSNVIWSLACLGTSCNILSASGDGSIRQCKQDGEPVGRPWTSDGRAVCSLAVSPDQSMVASGSTDGKLRLWNIKKGSMVGDPLEGHDSIVRCVDWSSNAQEIASGSLDGTIRRWNPDTGRRIAPPIATSRGMAHIFSGSNDNTIRKRRLSDGKELVVFRGHTLGIHSLRLAPDESHLISTSRDCSVRIWDLKTNQLVGDPLLHDDEVFAVILSTDGKYIASAGLDAKIYVWSLNAALKHAGNDHSADASNAKPDAAVKGHPVRSRDDMMHANKVSKQQPNNRVGGMSKYGKDFCDGDTNPTSHSTVPRASPLSALCWRNLLSFSPRTPNAPQSIPLEFRRWNFNLFSGGSSIRTIEVATSRKKNRIFVSPPSATELARAKATATMQRTNGNKASNSTQASQPQAVSGTEASQGRPTETQVAGDEIHTASQIHDMITVFKLLRIRRQMVLL